MTLIKSISGIRGTIGGQVGDNLTPVDIMRHSVAFGRWLMASNNGKAKVVVGRDARVSGPMVEAMVTGSLQSIGVEVVKIGLATTPTTEIAVVNENANGGVIITASHNPAQWNALKLLNSDGEFLTAKDAAEMEKYADDTEYVGVDKMIDMTERSYDQFHIDSVLSLKLVDTEAIKKANFTVAIDCVNSVGGIILPKLLSQLGVNNILKLNTEPTGRFAHNPEPIPANLTDISDLCRNNKVDVGFVVDPDVDRLAIICENGEMFGEEYTLVSVADYILSHTPGNTVSNLSSSRALRDVTQKRGGVYNVAAVGEVNVVTKMKETAAVIGGEGNGGVIYPESHYGRDALVGIALFLTQLAKEGCTVSELRSRYPQYHISKNKIQLTPEIDVDAVLEKVKEIYSKEQITDIDGVKIDFADKWVHLRKSNTEPIIRIYSEAKDKSSAEDIAKEVIDVIKKTCSLK